MIICNEINTYIHFLLLSINNYKLSLTVSHEFTVLVSHVMFGKKSQKRKTRERKNLVQGYIGWAIFVQGYIYQIHYTKIQNYSSSLFTFLPMQ